MFWGQWGKANKDKFDQHFKFDETPKQHYLGHEWRKEANGDWLDCLKMRQPSR